MKFDLLIKGGEVVDPGGRSGRLDVAIKRDRIAAVDTNIPAESALRVIDASGQYVTPGLIDLHTHIYHRSTYWGINPDPVAARSGVTTWLDVGSAGAYTWPGFREYIVKATDVNVYALLNISAIGLVAPTGELANLDYCDVRLCSKLIQENRDLLIGVKARIDTNTVRANGVEPLRRARQVAEECDVPMMTHIGIGPPALSEVLSLMRPGDILTHCFTGQSMRQIDDQGAVLEAAKQAWESGIIMDIGHGAGSFSFETAEAMMSAGYKPHVISSDIHQVSIHGPMFDMPVCLSKFMHLGMSFAEVIRASTTRPAEVLQLNDVGTLRVGAKADVALFKIIEGNFPLYDIFMNRRDAKQLVVSTQTILNGRPMKVATQDEVAPWIELTEDQLALIERGHTPTAFCQDC